MGILEKLFRMDERVVVVNGGAGRIGSQMCLALADAGAKVAILDLDEKNAIKTAAMVGEQTGGKVDWDRC